LAPAWNRLPKRLQLPEVLGTEPITAAALPGVRLPVTGIGEDEVVLGKLGLGTGEVGLGAANVPIVSDDLRTVQCDLPPAVVHPFIAETVYVRGVLAVAYLKSVVGLRSAGYGWEMFLGIREVTLCRAKALGVWLGGGRV